MCLQTTKTIRMANRTHARAKSTAGSTTIKGVLLTTQLQTVQIHSSVKGVAPTNKSPIATGCCRVVVLGHVSGQSHNNHRVDGQDVADMFVKHKVLNNEPVCTT